MVFVLACKSWLFVPAFSVDVEALWGVCMQALPDRSRKITTRGGGEPQVRLDYTPFPPTKGG